ncbi:MAG: 50S ribosomal protein L17 [Candidatus Taylorbacteria bacterium RIFCSPHIGHO2_02_FULL_46_13]|uniref:Large ribosomal subunit protein bL17 n=1 Tax=Candidatus Taylorbacteria bacterium RIFCSPHIGHO2_02_FULL_46_13 TaxID=1802312 RepID=A0A1G2MQZ0_9BACT|nr:MAG: 50S ribosomal protein L17 [Candidatus Taylorbacteria bacterium RIFCSPHIGHO2_02_FULL_46_13]
MRHHNANRKFGRTRDQRKALMRSLAESLIRDGKIQTTAEKAKELRPFVEKLITRAKIKTLASRRLLVSRLGSATIVARLITEIAPKYADRRGGYTRIAKIGEPRHDASAQAIIEFV